MTEIQRDTEKHKERQKKLKAKVDERVAQADKEQGVLLVVTGNGKGKTTAGFGSVTRAVGHGLKAAVVQFIKGNWDSGERNLLEKLGVDFHIMATGFTWETQDREGDIKAAKETWAQAEKLLADDSIDLVLLDELTYMVSYKYLPLEDILTALKNRPAKQHVVITGRACHREIIDMADTVSEVQPIKHAFDAGIKAQLGFDY